MYFCSHVKKDSLLLQRWANGPTKHHTYSLRQLKYIHDLKWYPPIIVKKTLNILYACVTNT